jgi:hypothetical protein
MTMNEEQEPAASSAEGFAGLAALPPPRLGRAKTDPGVGPPSGESVPPSAPMGVVVPPPSVHPAPVAAPSVDLAPTDRTPAGPPPVRLSPALTSEALGARKDSVEVLLEGMTDAHPARTRTKPQSDGEASAAYHAEHDLHAGRTGPGEEPKVLVDRRPPIVAFNAGRRGSREARYLAATEPEPTFVVRKDQSKRVIAAAVAGVLVALALAVGMKRMNERAATPAPAAERRLEKPTPAIPPAWVAPPSAETAATGTPTAAATEPPTATATATPTATATATPTATATATATATPTPTATAPSTATATPTATATATAPATRTAPASATPSASATAPPTTPPRVRKTRHKAPAAGDLGEFKTTF